MKPKNYQSEEVKRCNEIELKKRTKKELYWYNDREDTKMLGIYYVAITITYDDYKVTREIMFKERGKNLYKDQDFLKVIRKKFGLKENGVFEIIKFNILNYLGSGFDD